MTLDEDKKDFTVREAVEYVTKAAYMPIPAVEILEDLIARLGAEKMIGVIKYLDDLREC